MTHTHAKKDTRRYRYYVTCPGKVADGPAWRVSAKDVELIVRERLASLLLDQGRIYDLVADADGDPAAFAQAVKHADIAAATLRSGTAAMQLPLVRQLVEQVALRDEVISITVSASAILTLCGMTSSDARPKPIALVCPTATVRRGHELRLVIPAAGAPKPLPVLRDEELVALLAKAHAARQLALGSPGHSLNRIAADAGRCRTRLARLFGVAHLAPSIDTAIVEGRQPVGLRARDLLAAALPVDWAEQRELLGFGEPRPWSDGSRPETPRREAGSVA